MSTWEQTMMEIIQNARATKWEYITVEFQSIKGEFKPCVINEKKVDDWQNGQSYHAFINNMGEQGWEMLAPATLVFAVFKRPYQ